MKTFISRSTWASMALLALGALTYLCLGRHPGASLADGLAGGAPDTDPARRQSALEECENDVMQRLERRQHIVREVIAGRVTLAEAAARFQELDRASSYFNWERFRAGTPDTSDEQRQCYAVIDYVNTLLVNDPDQARAVTRRLEEELRALAARAAGTAPASAAPAGELAGRLSSDARP